MQQGITSVSYTHLDVYKRQHKIFLDLKLHDIPNTVKNGMKNLAKLDVDVVNLHAAGGSAMMKAAMELSLIHI